MKKNNGLPRFNADIFYPWAIFITLTITIFLTVYNLFFAHDLPKSIHEQLLIKLLPTDNLLAIFISILSLSFIAIKIWLVLHYRPYNPVCDKKLPLVTVIIPAYNEGSQILHTVRSVVASDYPPEKMQIICVDDGSKDDTWEWMQKAKKEFSNRVKLIRQPFNSGKKLALREGFINGKGSVFVTIDSDSEIFPDTLRHMVSPFVLDPRVGGVAGNVRVLNLNESPIPKMLEVSFAYAFDFIRSGQSVYGGVFCTPGALSAYRAEVVKANLSTWINQTFMGKRATIGEDRAMTNLILRMGYRVVYQRKAVVNTKIPTTFTGLRKMLLRWARSNVRENLVMFSFITRRFRPYDSGSNWIRLFSVTQLFRLTIGEAFKIAILIQLLMNPVTTLILIAIGSVTSAILPSIIYQKQHHNTFGWRWALPFSFYWVFALSWVSFWGLYTAAQSGWLTRETVTTPDPKKTVTVHQPHRVRRLLSKAA
jgi:hyaluronan synthase